MGGNRAWATRHGMGIAASCCPQGEGSVLGGNGKEVYYNYATKVLTYVFGGTRVSTNFSILISNQPSKPPDSRRTISKNKPNRARIVPRAV